jgi:hypothetical protein
LFWLLAKLCSVKEVEEVLVLVVLSESDLDGVVKLEKGGISGYRKCPTNTRAGNLPGDEINFENIIQHVQELLNFVSGRRILKFVLFQNRTTDVYRGTKKRDEVRGR